MKRARAASDKEMALKLPMGEHYPAAPLPAASNSFTIV